MLAAAGSPAYAQGKIHPPVQRLLDARHNSSFISLPAEGHQQELNLPQPVRVVVTIYNILGEPVRRLADQTYPLGTHRLVWDGADENGHRVASGVYLYRIQAGDFSDVKRMHLIR